MRRGCSGFQLCVTIYNVKHDIGLKTEASVYMQFWRRITSEIQASDQITRNTKIQFDKPQPREEVRAEYENFLLALILNCFVLPGFSFRVSVFLDAMSFGIKGEFSNIKISAFTITKRNYKT